VFSPDGRTVAAAGADGGAALFDTATGARTATLSGVGNNLQIGASDTLTTIAFSSDGRTLSVLTGNATVSVWDLTDPRSPVRARVLTRVTHGAGRVAFSPDAATVAGAATDGGNSVSLWPLT
jgi:WD40 repeat protein